MDDIATNVTTEIIEAIMALAPQIPEIVALGQSAIDIVQTGTVTDEQEAAIRAQLDAVKAQIDAAVASDQTPPATP